MARSAVSKTGMSTVSDRLTVLSQHVRSLNCNFPKLKSIVEVENPSIVCVQETWSVIGNYRIPNYQNLLHNTRKNRNGGGVGIWVHESLKAKRLERAEIFVDGVYESVVAEIRGKKKNEVAVIASIYSPPGINTPFYANLVKHIHLIQETQPNALIIMAGDMNIDFKQNPNHKLNIILQENNLTQIVTDATMVHSEKINDHIYVEDGTEVVKTMIEPTGISDHFTILADIDWKPSIKFREQIQTYSYNTERLDNFRKELNSYNWYKTLDNLDLDTAAIKFTSILSELNEKHCKTKFDLKPEKATFPKTILNLRSRVKSKYNAWKKDRLNEHKKLSYKTLLKRYEKTYKSFLNSKLEDSLKERNPRKLWQNIKMATNLDKGKNKDDIIINNSTDVSENFNDYFSTIATRIHANLTIPPGDPASHTPKSRNIFSFQSPCAEVVYSLLKNLRPKKSMGFDNISSKLLKELRFELTTPLTIILQKMVNSLKFPSYWKIAKVIPLHKKGDPTDTGNYRPISLLPSLSKIAEKFMANQIYKHLEENNILPSTQFGFRRGKSTGQAITNLMYELDHLNTTKKKYVLIMIDFSKAFDLIDHKILAKKLRILGFHESSTELIMSYLKDRKQYVHSNGKDSTYVTLNAVGCPQGSVMGPLLYLIYTIDIKNLIGKHFHIMFADDTGLIIELKSGEGLAEVEQLMEKIFTHFTINKLKMNVDKTVLMGKGIDGEIEVGGKKMQITCNGTGERYLGVKINPKLKWDEHFADLMAKIKFGLYALAKIKRVRNIQVKKSVYEAFIKSHLCYAMHAWYPGLTKHQKTTLEKMNKSAIRMVIGAKRHAHTAELYKVLKILKVEDLYINTVIAGARKLTEPINKNNNLNKYMKILESKTRASFNYTPLRKGKLIDSHAGILNSHKEYLLKELRTETVLEHLKMEILTKYHTGCDGADCRSCEQTNKVLAALAETEA